MSTLKKHQSYSFTGKNSAYFKCIFWQDAKDTDSTIWKLIINNIAVTTTSRTIIITKTYSFVLNIQCICFDW